VQYRLEESVLPPCGWGWTVSFLHLWHRAVPLQTFAGWHSTDELILKSVNIWQSYRHESWLSDALCAWALSCWNMKNSPEILSIARNICKWMCSLRLPVSSILSSLFVALHCSLSDDTDLNKLMVKTGQFTTQCKDDNVICLKRQISFLLVDWQNR